jgi:5,10-methenyltetrahydrofolate synthetase
VPPIVRPVPPPAGETRVSWRGVHETEKAELRRQILARRDALGAECRAALSAVILRTVRDLPAFAAARTVLAYSSFGSEPETDAFVVAVLEEGKTLALPRVDRRTRSLELYGVSEPGRQLRPGVWGIREPDPTRCPPVPPAEIDFVLVPGLVFDVRGGRIGYGAGYYDRLLRRCPPTAVLVAGAFDLQVVPEVPMEPHDRWMDRVVTERATYPGPKGAMEP